MKKQVLRFFAVISAIVLTAVFYGCYKDKRLHKEEIENSKRNARIYMKQKYGIDVEVVDVSDYGIVTVNDGENDFHVDGRSDDYQAEEIENALLDMIKTDIPTAFKCEFDYRRRRGMYYNGDNLDAVLDENDTLYVYCVNTDFKEVPVFDFLRDNISQCRLYSFSSEEMLNDFIEYGGAIGHYAPFIDSYCVVYSSDSDFKTGTYNIQKYNDFMYYLPYAKNDVEPELIFEEIHESYFDWTDSEYEFISAYGLKKDCDSLIWFPIPEDKKNKDFYWTIEYYYYDEKVQKTEKCHIIDGYAVNSFLSLIENDVKFALVCK
ncbi:MAG: hypothetical protein NC040_07965 [Muribaculaceae bacterium]|nr:hypothetical protein [Alistipes senegalensis]MCM1473980.1 hypothetical protein [Muribaculaceae bacterium]